jgi:hypothetical protein
MKGVAVIDGVSVNDQKVEFKQYSADRSGYV